MDDEDIKKKTEEDGRPVSPPPMGEVYGGPAQMGFVYAGPEQMKNPGMSMMMAYAGPMPQMMAVYAGPQFYNPGPGIGIGMPGQRLKHEGIYCYCEKCGKENADNKFCTDCGSPLGGVKRYTDCGSCGARNLKEHKFCRDCGQPLKKDGGPEGKDNGGNRILPA
ncbi:MAG: zinc ribbon domain-containing protein [Lachnospiraceae bacterium]|nr:zinc ribbon domain-containing protein [Lachnospiraceae bacterium]